LQAHAREERHDTITTDDIDDYRRELLDSHLSPRTVQKILVLLHGVMKLAKRRGMIMFPALATLTRPIAARSTSSTTRGLTSGGSLDGQRASHAGLPVPGDRAEEDVVAWRQLQRQRRR
jgi:hypothetical protein